MSLKIYPGFNELSLLEAALLSILVDASLKGKSEALTIKGLAADTFSPSEEVIDALRTLTSEGRLVGVNDYSWDEVGSISPGDICISAHVQQRALDYGDKAPSALEPKHNRSGGADAIEVARVTYYAYVGSAPKSPESEEGVGDFNLIVLDGPMDDANTADTLLNEDFDTIEEAWERFDAFIELKTELADQESDPLAGVEQFNVTTDEKEVIAVAVKANGTDLFEVTFAADCIGESGTHVKMVACKEVDTYEDGIEAWAQEYAQALRDRYVS